MLKYCNSMYLSGSCAVMGALQMDSQREKQAEKIILSENIQLKILLDV